MKQNRWIDRITGICPFGSLCFLFSLLLVACSASVPFPDVDYSKLRMTLMRSACFGRCPDYQVTIRGDGDIEFSTRHVPDAAKILSVQVPGTHHARVDRAQVDALLQKFRDANFFSLRGEYRALVTDIPTYMVSIDTGHGSKRVIDYDGRRIGMPQTVTEIADAIDATSGSRRWIKGIAPAK